MHLDSSKSSSCFIEQPLKEDSRALGPSKKAIILSGPTGAGKTALSLILAKALGGEIISADSMQVYRGMDIGTAKANREQLKEVPHHLINIKALSEPFNVVEFYYQALDAMNEIILRDKVPIIVGGTGFYIHTLIYGPPLGPPADPIVRKKLEEDMEKFGPEPLYEKVKELDPVYAAKITRGDRHKIIRALEIISLTHRKVSEFLRTHEHHLSAEYKFKCWFIHYSKDILYKRIEDRCEEMLEAGFLDEVKNLISQGLKDNISACQAIGYKQALEYFETGQTDADYDEFVWAFKKASKRYAKRQFTWFRKEPLFRWLNLDAYNLLSVAELILHDFESSY